MKIIFVLRSVAVFGGIERVVVDKANYLAEQGNDILLVTYEQGQHSCVYKLNDGVNHIDVDCRFFTIYRYNLLIRYLKLWRMLHSFKKRFHRLVCEYTPDLIVAVSNAGEYMNQVMTAPFGKKILEAHGAYPAIMDSSTLIKRIQKMLFLRAIRKSDMIISLTSKDKLCWMKEIDKVVVVPNPLSFYYESINTFERKMGRIICVARLEHEKRIDRLIDAFSLIANSNPLWYVDVYGDGQDREMLYRQIKRLGLEDRIHLNPPTNNIAQEYLTSQFLVISSDSEGFGLVIIEAMACGTPVVSTDCPFGPSDIIEDGVDGLLCEMNVQSLANKIEWMIIHDEERKEMGIKAHESVARYRKEYVMKEWEQVYRSILDVY